MNLVPTSNKGYGGKSSLTHWSNLSRRAAPLFYEESVTSRTLNLANPKATSFRQKLIDNFLGLWQNLLTTRVNIQNKIQVQRPEIRIDKVYC